MVMYKLNQVPSEAQIKKYIRRIVFGKNIYCPKCKSRLVFKYGQRYRCQDCREKFSLVSHTWLKCMKITFQKFWLILWCWVSQIPVKQSTALCRLSEEAIRHWYDLFRNNLPEDQVILQRVVQLDEAFFKQISLMMAKQKGTRKLAYEVLTTTNIKRHHALYFLQQHIKPGTNLNTDGASIYKTIDQWWPVNHYTDIHKKFQFGLTSEIEGIFGNFRTFVRRMYHHVTADNLSDLVREFCYRFSSPEIFDNPGLFLEKTLQLVPLD
jgi:transposase-like protein